MYKLNPTFCSFVNLFKSAYNPSEISMDELANLNRYLCIATGKLGKKYFFIK